MLRPNRIGQYALVGIVAALTGCNTGSTSPSKKIVDSHPTIPSSSPAIVVPPNAGKVTETEARIFGIQLIDSLKRKDQKKFDDLMRMDEMFIRAAEDAGLSQREIDEYKKIILPGLMSMYPTLSVYGAGGAAKLIGVRPEKDRAEIVLRFASEEDINYFTVTLTRYADGAVGMAEWLPASTAENLSLTYRRIFLPMIMSKNDGNAAIKPIDRLRQEHSDTFKEVLRSTKERDGDRAIKLLRTLPIELQNDRTVALMGLMAAAKASAMNYQEEIERFSERYPNDPCLDLNTLQYWAVKRDWKKGLESIERLDEFVGGDVYLNAFRVPLLIMAGKTAEAKLAAEKLLTDEPDLAVSFTTMANYLISIKDFAGAVEQYKHGVTKIGIVINIDTVLSNPDFVEFVKSIEFADLKKWYESRPK